VSKIHSGLSLTAAIVASLLMTNHAAAEALASAGPQPSKTTAAARPAGAPDASAPAAAAAPPKAPMRFVASKCHPGWQRN